MSCAFCIQFGELCAPCRAELDERQDLRATIDRLTEELREAREQLREGCTCGSGGHPRRCKRHPRRYDKHVEELNREARLEDVEAECKRLAAEVERLEGAGPMRDVMEQHARLDRLEASLAKNHADAVAECKRLAAENAGRDRRETILVEALKKCRNLTHLQHTNPADAREFGERVAKVVKDAFLLAALEGGDPEPRTEAVLAAVALAEADVLERDLTPSLGAWVSEADSKAHRAAEAAYVVALKDYRGARRALAEAEEAAEGPYR